MRVLISMLCSVWASLSMGAEAPSPAMLSVWVTEAVVSAYTYSAQNYMVDQQHLAHYFTGSGWIAYSEALNKSGLPKMVQENHYIVGSVIMSPPAITEVAPGVWRATVPLLAVYHNTQIEQKQTLQVTLTFKAAKGGQGVRGLAIEQFESVETKPTCTCDIPPEPEVSPTELKKSKK